MDAGLASTFARARAAQTVHSTQKKRYLVNPPAIGLRMDKFDGDHAARRMSQFGARGSGNQGRPQAAAPPSVFIKSGSRHGISSSPPHPRGSCRTPLHSGFNPIDGSSKVDEVATARGQFALTEWSTDRPNRICAEVEAGLALPQPFADAMDRAGEQAHGATFSRSRVDAQSGSPARTLQCADSLPEVCLPRLAGEICWRRPPRSRRPAPWRNR